MQDKKPEDKNQSSSSRKNKAPGLEMVVVRNMALRVVQRRMVVMVLLSLLAMTISILSAIQVVRMKTPPQYVQLTDDGRIEYPLPLDKPSAEDSEIIRFASESAKWINTYDYISWRDQIQLQSKRFTPGGWENYLKSFGESKTLVTVQENKLVVSMTPTGPPQMVKQGIATNTGQYTWLVSVPAVIKYASGLEGAVDLTQSGQILMFVTRTPQEVAARGYAIQVYQFKAE